MMKEWVVAIALATVAISVTAQPLSFNFRKVTPADGLNMSIVTSVCEDKYGYIWIGTGGGLSRFDGYTIRLYEHRFRDTTSLMPSPVRDLFCDTQGRLWISFMNGLMQYDYEQDCFKNYPLRGATWVQEVVEAPNGFLYVGTSDGLIKLNPSTGDMVLFDSLNTVGRGWASQVWDIDLHQGQLYLATRNGVTRFDPHTEQWQPISLPAEAKNQAMGRIAIGPNGDVWMSGRDEGNPVWRTTLRFDAWKKYTEFSTSAAGQPGMTVEVFYDCQGRLWLSSTVNAIGMYDPFTDRIRPSRIEPWMPNGVSTSYMIQIYQDRKGQIWTSSLKGVNYFHPDNNFFQTLLPGNRADAEDTWYMVSDLVERPDGKYWVSTGGGLVLFDPVSGAHTRYWNESGKAPVLFTNALRGLCLDRQGDLWICTNRGLNLLRAGGSKIEFMGQKVGIPEVITVSAMESSDGTLWIANYSEGGHYYRPPGDSKFHPLQHHPVLKEYANRFGHCMLEDSRGWLWFGLDGMGLICYDPVGRTSRLWERSSQNDTTLIGNYVNALSEDPHGIIWAATTMGLSSIDPHTFRFTNYDRVRGLPTNRLSSVLADGQGRIWIGTPQGLLMLDSTRQRVRQFDLNDGLPEKEFMPMPARRLSDGQFAFGTRRGMLLFYPEAYVQNEATSHITPLLSGVRVFNQPFETHPNPEALSVLTLPPGKNFFSLDFTALHYANPRQTWYAYKMEPYDQDWTYTRDHTANYTNVPPGAYTFHYKATTDPNNWAVPQRSLRIRVQEYWYLSRWLWGGLAFVAALLGITAFRRRAQLREAFLQLERKAQALSKEKALVQYENLTQQLNPHFLFNSLASLGSLIRFDQKTASEFLEALSKMYRYILQSRDRETVPLQEEVMFAEHFLKLQQTRFERAFQVRFKIDPALQACKIVPVTLQNLLENALKHNTFDEDDPLVVDIFTEGHYLVVRNNVQRRTVVETSNKQGLVRLRSLYQYLSDVPLLIEEAEGFFTIKIPLLTA